MLTVYPSNRLSAIILLVTLNIRTYHELTEPDRSGLPDPIAAQPRPLVRRMQR